MNKQHFRENVGRHIPGGGGSLEMGRTTRIPNTSLPRRLGGDVHDLCEQGSGQKHCALSRRIPSLRAFHVILTPSSGVS